METTDYTFSDGRGQLQELRRFLARAVSQSVGNVAKVAWLSAVIDSVTVDVTADESWSRVAADSDTTSNSSVPELLVCLARAASEATEYSADYKTQLLQDLVDAKAILTA